MADEKTCGAKTRAGTPCQQPAGWGTEHAGEGRCRFHGGATPVKSGRYSKVKREAVRNLIEQFEKDDDPLDIEPEIAAARALFQDFIERYDEWREALLAWHYSYNGKDTPKPRKVLDISDAYRILKTIAQIAQKEKKLRMDDAVSRKDLNRVLMEMARVVEMEVDDEETRKRIKNGWSNIHLA